MNATKTGKHVEVWPDEATSGRMDSPWIVSIETDAGSTTKYIDYDYDIARELAIQLGDELDLKVVARNRLGEARTIQTPRLRTRSKKGE